MITVIATLLVIGAAGLALRLYMGRDAENRLMSGEEIAIAALRPPLPENGFLACPPGYCQVPDAMASPVFDLPIGQLGRDWNDIVAQQPRIVAVAADPAALREVVIQHSALLGFPDIVTVEFVPLADGRSSLAIYSRARYGRSDFGVNRRRVEHWLELLKQRAAQPAKPGS